MILTKIENIYPASCRQSSSDIWMEGDQLLGVGRSLTIALPAGLHTLTLTVDDGAGNVGSAQVTVTAGAAAFLPLVQH